MPWRLDADGQEVRRGGYVYLGRRDRMVKRRGYRIELGEIERALYQHPALAEVAVLGMTDPSGLKIVAYLASRDQTRPSIVELKAFRSQNLPVYMSPDVFTFIDALPRTSTNKVDYHRLGQGMASV